MSVHADPPPSVVPEPNGITYITGEQLGKGGFAICHRAEVAERGKATGRIIALKIVKSKMEPAKMAQKFVTELQLHSKLQHPNIVEFYRAFTFGPSTYVVLEVCDNGSLADALKRRKFFTMPEIRRFLIQTCGAVKYLHARQIIHRDLKTGNLFLDSNMNIKVGDFGLAAVMVSKNDVSLRRTTMCGTPNYLAPEILEKGGRGHNEKVDLWAIGIIAYTLAIGKAPFHAPKREDIYKKLQMCDYKWPDPSKTQNDISNDLRDLVATLLVHEDDRPCPDQIVSHTFFKTAFIPETMESSCTSVPPRFPAVRPPTAAVIQRGFSDSWFRLCKASGVGEFAPGKLFPVIGGRKLRSVVRDCEKELQIGRHPVVPIPEGTIYLPYPDRVDPFSVDPNAQLSDIIEEREPSAEGRALRETSANEPGTTRALAEKAKRIRRSKENTEPATTADDREPEAQLQRKPARTIASRTMASAPKRRAIATQRSQSIQVARVPEMKVDSKIPQTTKVVETVVVSADTENIPPAAQESTRQTRRNKAVAMETVRIVGNIQEPPVMPRETCRVTRKNSKRAAPLREPEQPEQLQLMEIALPKRPALTVMPKPVVDQQSSRPSSRDGMTVAPRHAGGAAPRATRIPSGDVGPKVPYTDPETVLARVANLRDNIADALSNRYATPGRLAKPKLPFISKWVDYSKAYGVGYMLEDGSIGTVLKKEKPKPTFPVTLAVVRNGYAKVREVRKNPDAMLSLPFEYYADFGGAGIRSVGLGPEMKKEKVGIWLKLVSYLAKQVSADEAESAATNSATETPDTIVKFYQRLGNVGVWGFTDGSFQINFPDHTKLNLSSDGRYCNFLCLSKGGIRFLEQHSALNRESINGRKSLHLPIHTLLWDAENYPVAVDVAHANHLRGKLQFFLEALDEWLRCKGVGVLSEEAKYLRWNGSHTEEGKKMDWVTVGAHGGDVERYSL
ncbi:kinase-like protein [Eremomyces bilateralis CBS 781.70]|uniref:Kinase-like protein n=1 Tax=Eremomyces bilateralis CBS 781.70 TaxID=1392243 RepID=A0A6G1G258_9PEZI|nr:kinase-like protein [Eremomyces bilateralis CBS 781.70]KAF1812197.1 kinase-like protein [Eremomyces bilateralis CBS 781.70]